VAPITATEFGVRAEHLRLLLFDVDGVLTDGSVNVDSSGGEMKRFHIRDGAALAYAQHAGLMTGVLSARASGATTVRAKELQMSVVVQGTQDKYAALTGILAEHQLTLEEVAYMGDDLVDLPVLRRVGLSAAPADAAPEVAAIVHFVSWHSGGDGAVREFIEAVLKARGQWDDVLARFA
jgi:3-deoxy-D-manno-octulosonate 8-phosphate phosphatase (KDO 8-P phosphatase)